MCKELITYVPKNAPELLTLMNGNVVLADSIRIVFHQIYLSLLSKWTTDQDGNKLMRCGAWVPLCSKILERQIGCGRYRNVVDHMIAFGLVQEKTNGAGHQSYGPNHCKQYRIPTRNFQGSKPGMLFRKEKVTVPWLVSKLLEYQESKEQRAIEDLDLGNNRNLKGWIQMTRDLVPMPLLVDDQKTLAVSLEKRQLVEHFAEQHQVIGLDAVHQDEFGQRTYSHITNIPSSFRRMYRFKGYENHTHVNIDISNSQPYMAGLLLKNPKCIRGLIPEFTPLVKVIQRHSEKSDTQQFFDLVRSGEFYEHISTKANLSLERSKIKELCFTAIFYGRNRLYSPADEYTELKAVRDAFKQFFPHVFQTITAIKKVGKNHLPFMDEFYWSRKTGERLTNGSYKNLSCAMQRMESRLVWRVNNRLMKLNATPFTTIHDSWWTIEKNESDVRKQVKIVFQRFGVEPPQLRTTKY